MDIHSIRMRLKTSTIYDIPLRVIYYARVSSESDEQLNSLSNQVSYYENFIKNNSKWIYSGGYIDEGISGMSTKHRENFHRMIDDAKNDKFDLIITKEISRFARNTLDSIQYTRQLLSCGVGVFFQNDNINTLDEDSELRLTIMSGIAQDELRKLSSRVKFGHQQAIKNKVVLGNSRIFGYEKSNKKLVVDESQAKMVRELFELYSTDKYSMKQIENIFWDKGYRNLNGNKIAHSTISNMISNPKYKGYYVGNKVRVVDMFTKKQKFLPPEEWVYFKDETGEIVPAIISEDLWNRANEILSKRSEDVRSRQGVCNHNNLFTGKLYCTHCGKPYYKKESKGRNGIVNNRWVCSGKLANGYSSCPSSALFENELKPILLDALSGIGADSKKMIDEYTNLYYSSRQDKEIAEQIEQKKKIIELAKKKRAKLLGYNATGKISDDDFIAMNNQCTKEIEKANEEIETLSKDQLSDEEFKKQISLLKSNLENARADAAKGEADKSFIDRYIDKILVTVDENRTILEIKIFTGETTKRYLNRLRQNASEENKQEELIGVSTGHTFKKIRPIRTMKFNRVCRTLETHSTSVTYDYKTNI